MLNCFIITILPKQHFPCSYKVYHQCARWCPWKSNTKLLMFTYLVFISRHTTVIKLCTDILYATNIICHWFFNVFCWLNSFIHYHYIGWFTFNLTKIILIRIYFQDFFSKPVDNIWLKHMPRPVYNTLVMSISGSALEVFRKTLIWM